MTDNNALQLVLKEHDNYFQTLTQEEKEVIYHYTAGGSVEINSFLRGGFVFENINVSEHVTILKSIIKEAPRLSDKITVYVHIFSRFFCNFRQS